ncbi:Protein phosphatase Slingshot [Halotydeus destructor]|nr:Protein phosphatase Slingshot [Halotydeus destructor]
MIFYLRNNDRMAVYPGANSNSEIHMYLPGIFNLLRQEDTLKMAVRLESVHPNRRRYLAVVMCDDKTSTEESCILGIDFDNEATIGLILPIWADSSITLDGDGGFSIVTASKNHIFKPVSVQAMWSSLQTLHSGCKTARKFNFFPGGSSHKWAQYYKERIFSNRSCLNEWHAMDDLISKRPSSPDLRSKPVEQEATEELIKQKLKEIMTSVDLDVVTSKYIRTKVEEALDMNLTEYKSYIDQEMLTILGQMGTATQIFEYLYLGSEWNASNLEELKLKGVGKILNVTREVDNFYPGAFDYYNIRVYDDDSTEMIRHWDKTYRYIYKSMEEGSKVLVHCKMGISRSASVVIAYVMKSKNWSLKQALQFVKNKRNCIRPNENFLKQLEVYQGILNASKQRHNSLWRSKSETNVSSTCTSAASSPTPKLMNSKGDDEVTPVDNILGIRPGGVKSIVNALTQSACNISTSNAQSPFDRRRSWSPDESYSKINVKT